MTAHYYSKSVLLASADSTRIVEVFIDRTFHERWAREDNTIGPHVTEGGLFRTIDLKGFSGLADAEQHIDTATAAEQRLIDLVEYEGFREVTEAEAQHLMETCPQDPLPEPPAGMMPGTYAYTAWLMAKTGMMTGDEADRWKDQMKDEGL